MNKAYKRQPDSPHTLSISDVVAIASYLVSKAPQAEATYALGKASARHLLFFACQLASFVRTHRIASTGQKGGSKARVAKDVMQQFTFGTRKVVGRGVPEPDDEDLSPWHADLLDEEDDERDLPPEEPVRQSLHVPALDDEGVPVRRSPWRKRRGRRLVKKQAGEQRYYTPEQRLLLLDTWLRSGLPAKDFSGLVGVSKHTLYSWKKRFDDHGPAGLVDAPRGARKGSRLPEVTKRAILMLKQGNPEYGVQRISDMLFRGPGLPASPSAVARVLH